MHAKSLKYLSPLPPVPFPRCSPFVLNAVTEQCARTTYISICVFASFKPIFNNQSIQQSYGDCMLSAIIFTLQQQLPPTSPQPESVQHYYKTHVKEPIFEMM